MVLLNFPEGLPAQEVAPGVVFRVAWGDRLMAAHCTIEPRGTIEELNEYDYKAGYGGI